MNLSMGLGQEKFLKRGAKNIIAMIIAQTVMNAAILKTNSMIVIGNAITMITQYAMKFKILSIFIFFVLNNV